MKRIAVVVLNWNGWRDTVACVASLRAQTQTPEWIIVVDNASTDDSERRLRETCPDVQILQSGSNLGFAGGNNIGIRWAMRHGADAVWLLNNDAAAAPDALEVLARVDDARPEVGAIGARIYRMDRRDVLQCWGGGWINLWAGRAREFDAVVMETELDYISGCSLYLPRRALERCGMLDEGFFMYFEDAELSLRYRRAGFLLAVADRARVFHKGGASARPGRTQSRWRTQSLLRVLKLHAPLYPVSVALSTVLRGASLLGRRDWEQFCALVEDVPSDMVNPDWRIGR